MITFLVCLAILIVGYFTYGRVVAKIIGHDDSIPTPAHRLKDGVDYVELPWWKVLLTQFLNIAGVGPIFGAISGAMFGPVVFIWIVLGSILIGGVHDFLSGYISIKHDGESVSEIVGYYLGNHARTGMRIFSLILLMLVGVVFTMAPAEWLATQNGWHPHTWIMIIMVYYVIATIVPIHLLIAKLFPAFSIILILMCIVLFFGMVIGQINGTVVMQEFTFDYAHPLSLAVFPFLFVTVACGAVSGFHSTKSPMMARCIRKESESQRVFYGAMILEGIVALVWAAAAMAIVGDRFRAGVPVGQLGGPGGVVDYASNALIGSAGIILVIIAVVIFPVTSGDTTFRSIRLLLSDAFKINQSSMRNRVLISLPLFAIAIALTFIDFDIIWRYFAWSNQTLAAMVLWAGATFLLVNNKFHLIASIPAAFLTFISISYILQAPNEGFGLAPTIGNTAGIIVAVGLFVLFMIKASKTTKSS
ncbi:MAG: carbon starvation protein A [Defluviitaleaceae bacterium]|nr:carbon starvation protein A [Defluviitaleaceae bacterium]